VYCSRCGTENADTAKFCASCGLDLTATTPVRAIRSQQEKEVTEVELVREQLHEEYEILEELGRGGMAIVFRAREKQLEREVAIKVLPFSLAFDKEFVERFQREARTAAKLEHPSIIPIYRVGKAGRVIYFVMKFLRGEPLSAVLGRQGAVQPDTIRRILLEVGRALAYAHKSGIVHRDIKPDNIMFDEHGHAVVTDFGIAKAASGGKLTGTGMAIGTPHYMSPEQARAQPLDGRSDIYSMGVVAYQCLTGSVPFDGEDSFAIGYKHIMEPLPVPPLDSTDQRDLFEIVKQMMAKQPEERFQTAEELVRVLEAGSGYVATGISTAAPRTAGPMSERLAQALTTPLPRQAGGRTIAPPAHKRSALGGLFVFLLVIGGLFGGGGYYAYRQGLLGDLGFPAPGDTTGVAAGGGGPAASSTLTDAAARDTLGLVGVDSVRDTARATRPAPGTPGKLVLEGVPPTARVTLNGQPVRGAELDLPPGAHKVVVRAPGFHQFERQVVITPGGRHTMAVSLLAITVGGGRQGAGGEGGAAQCEEYGPEYNRDNLCFDTRPVPQTATFVPVSADAPIFPRAAILLIHVSREGTTLSARVFVPSNVETFNTQALDMAKNLRWNPGQKNGEPADAWVQSSFQPQRQ
jgi:serine/threonine-protein kinase